MNKQLKDLAVHDW